MRRQLDQQDIDRLMKLKTRHKIRLADDVYSPGKIDVEAGFRAYQIDPAELKGKRVLDVGAWTGGFSFHFENMGAEVVAIDVMDPAESHFDVFKETLGSSVRFERMTVYDLDPELVGTFDLVFFQGVFYHLKHPILAFEKLNAVLNPGGLLLCSGTTGDMYFEHAGKVIAPHKEIPAIADFPMAFFVRDKFLKDPSNWWIPNEACVEAWAKRTGFSCRWIKTKEGGRSLSGEPRSLVRLVAEKVSDPEPEFQSSKQNTTLLTEAPKVTERPTPATKGNGATAHAPAASTPSPASKTAGVLKWVTDKLEKLGVKSTPAVKGGYETVDVSLGDLRRLWDYSQQDLHGTKYSVKGIEYPWILTSPEWNESRKALDVGCGYSTMPDYIQKKFGCEVWAVDDFGKSVGEQQWERERDVETHVKKYDNIQFVIERLGDPKSSSLPTNYFDIIYSLSALEHVPAAMLVDVWRHMDALLRVGGELVHGVDIRLPAGNREHLEKIFDIEDNGASKAIEHSFIPYSAYLYTKWVYKALGIDAKVPEKFKTRNVMYGNDVLMETVNVFTRDIKVYKKLYYHNVIYYPLLLRLRKTNS